MYMSHYTSLHHLIRQIIYEYFSHYLQGALLSTLSARAKSNTCAATKANSDVKSDCRFGSWANRALLTGIAVLAAALALTRLLIWGWQTNDLSPPRGRAPPENARATSP